MPWCVDPMKWSVRTFADHLKYTAYFHSDNLIIVKAVNPSPPFLPLPSARFTTRVQCWSVNSVLAHTLFFWMFPIKARKIGENFFIDFFSFLLTSPRSIMEKVAELYVQSNFIYIF